ncbi:MAG: hypothetical protein R3244_04820 [Thermoanaerobaculia bacterium]|nr:hypothetical protein [Thermoanaerobaculia bacterium]
MIRLAAVRTLLLEEIATLPPGRDRSEPADERLGRARNRAALVVALDWVAILILFLWRPEESFLILQGSEEGVFTLAVLVVATHAGYRLAQIQTLGAVDRALESLPADPSSEEPPPGTV